ncbi:MAG: hypothetical protein AAF184_12160 [Pseudomonadota bacterium]
MNLSALFFRLWVITWAGALLLVFAQGYFMSRQVWMLPVGFVLCAACLWGGARWGARVAKRGPIARNVLRLIAALHIWPLAAQLTALGEPRWDNLILALVGWGLLEAAGFGARKSAPTDAVSA